VVEITDAHPLPGTRDHQEQPASMFIEFLGELSCLAIRNPRLVGS